MQTKKLYRSREDRQVAGVCGGLAAYFGFDATLVRLIFVAMALFGGPGVILYIIMALVVPEAPRGYYEEEKRKNDSTEV